MGHYQKFTFRDFCRKLQAQEYKTAVGANRAVGKMHNLTQSERHLAKAAATAHFLNIEETAEAKMKLSVFIDRLRSGNYRTPASAHASARKVQQLSPTTKAKLRLLVEDHFHAAPRVEGVEKPSAQNNGKQGVTKEEDRYNLELISRHAKKRAWVVAHMARGFQHKEYFTDVRFGGRHFALQAAIKYRNGVKRCRLPPGVATPLATYRRRLHAGAFENLAAAYVAAATLDPLDVKKARRLAVMYFGDFAAAEITRADVQSMQEAKPNAATTTVCLYCPHCGAKLPRVAGH